MSNRIAIPEHFSELAQILSREVIRSQPSSCVDFLAELTQTMQALANGSISPESISEPWAKDFVASFLPKLNKQE